MEDQIIGLIFGLGLFAFIGFTYIKKRKISVYFNETKRIKGYRWKI